MAHQEDLEGRINIETLNTQINAANTMLAVYQENFYTPFGSKCLLIGMAWFLIVSLCLHRFLRGDFQRRNLDFRMTAITPVVLPLLDHVHLMAPFRHW
jgi:hypothetical protein